MKYKPDKKELSKPPQYKELYKRYKKSVQV